MAGEWTLAKYKYTNSSGLSYYYPASGTFDFDNCQEDTCNYQINFNYTINDTTENKKFNGWYYFVDENAEYFDMVNIETSGVVDTLRNGRVILITKSDMKTEFSDSTGRHTFWLEK